MSSRMAISSMLGRVISVLKSVNEISERRVVGKPEVLSRLRFVNIIRREDETDAESSYRTQYEALQKWNNEYWAENNERFHREKEEYIRKNFNQSQQMKSDQPDQEIQSHDQLAPFYKDFLERNIQTNMEYNKLWYRLHARLLIEALKAKYSRFSLLFG